mgnify:CR=1 FL=1
MVKKKNISLSDDLKHKRIKFYLKKDEYDFLERLSSKT